MSRLERLQRTLAALRVEHRPARLLAHLRSEGVGWADRAEAQLDSGELVDVREQAVDLHDRGIDTSMLGDDMYPSSLAALAKPPPLMFLIGNTDLLNQPSIGMCGSRNVSEIGLGAAKGCGDEVAAQDLVVVSGYAKGVDTETHLAALRSGGRTVIVLAEGILHFRRKKVFGNLLDLDRVLVLSQFPPAQRWNVGAAMTRNAVISGLGRAMVVIEAGETGGTLNAGLQALEMGRPVIALEFESQPTPDGNRILIGKGAVPVRSQAELRRVLKSIEHAPRQEPRPDQQAML